MLSSIKKHGTRAKGQQELIRHLGGKRLTRSQAIKAKCYDCMGYYADSPQDCLNETCPLYAYMPYSKLP